MVHHSLKCLVTFCKRPLLGLLWKTAQDNFLSNSLCPSHSNTAILAHGWHLALSSLCMLTVPALTKNVSSHCTSPQPVSCDLQVNSQPQTHLHTWATEKHHSSDVHCQCMSSACVSVCLHMHVYDCVSLSEEEAQKWRIWQWIHTVQMKGTHSALISKCSWVWMVALPAERKSEVVLGVQCCFFFRALPLLLPSGWQKWNDIWPFWKGGEASKADLFWENLHWKKDFENLLKHEAKGRWREKKRKACGLAFRASTASNCCTVCLHHAEL